MQKNAIILISNRHIHLTREALDTLFGSGYQLTVKKRMGDPIFAANETVTLVGPKGEISGVRILGPLRSYNQAEVMKADCFKLGVMAPIRLSGSPDIAPIKVVGPAGSLELEHGLVIAKRHLHIRPEQAAEYGIAAGQTIQVKVSAGERALIFDQVAVVYTDIDAPTVHVDVEEGNAAAIANGDIVELLT